MLLKLSVFIGYVLLFFILIYIIGKIWFTGKRGRNLTLFFLMGIGCALFALFNGINMLVSEELYESMYTMSMLIVCVLPHLITLYYLSFVNSKLLNSKIFVGAIIALSCIDIIMLLTNPLHRLFITGFDGRVPNGGVYSNIHMLISYVPLLFGIGVLFRYIVKNIKRSPSLILVFIGTMIPVVSSLLFSMKIISENTLGFDPTPLSFLLMFILFAIHSIRMRLFNVKQAAVLNVFDTLNDATLVVDYAGFVIDTNPAFRKIFPSLKIENEKTSAVDILNYFLKNSNDLRENIAETLLFSENQLNNAEVTLYTENNGIKHYSVYMSILYERGKNAGRIISLADVTNYKSMIEEINERNKELVSLKDIAESASKAKTAFLANMSHEIRTPLNAILGMTEIAKNSKSEEKTKSCLLKIDNASRHLLSILNDILDMSKIEANKYDFKLESFKFSLMIENIVNVFSIRVKEKRQKFAVDVSADIPPYIVSDQLKLTQVVYNLLSNAIKFTHEGGDISLKVSMPKKDKDSGQLLFCVKDNGIGIDKEKQKVLFKAFTQADNSISRQYGGTGLGLAISKNIAELLGGDITIESEKGKGSLFSFSVTVGIDNSISQEAEGLIAPDYDFNGKTFLLAEDVEINREIIIEFFSEKNVRVDCAENGERAYEMFISNPMLYDLIYMDIHMPKMDGYACTRKIRESNAPNAKTIPIIAMTANAFDEDVKRCLETGMNDHIAKPIDIGVFFQKTSEVLTGMKKK